MERNLFDETVGTLARHGHTLDYIEHITLYNTGIELDEFVQFISDFQYDSGYGCEYVPPFILKMYDGTWYERAEYDGSEWWKFNKAPDAPELYGSIVDALIGADMAWMYKKACDRAEQVEYDNMCYDLLAEEEYRKALYEERMDALSDEYDGIMDAPVVPSKKNCHDSKGKYAQKSRCVRYKLTESAFGLLENWAWKHQSRCWKDQRGKGRRRRDTQHRA